MKIKRFFLKASKAWTWLLIGIFFLLNILLLIKLSRIQTENRTWKSKVNLSLAAQISLMEHNLEGEYMGSEIELLLKQVLPTYLIQAVEAAYRWLIQFSNDKFRGLLERKHWAC